MAIGFSNPATRIVVAAVGMLVVTSMVVGAAVFLVMEQRLTQAVSGVLSDTLASRSRLFVALIDLRESQTLYITTRPGLKRSLRAIASGPERNVAQETAAVQAILQSFIAVGFGGLAYLDNQGQELARAGNFSEAPLLKTALATPLRSELAWTDSFTLHTRVPVTDSDGPLGTMVVEQRLPIVTPMLERSGNHGETGETALCFARNGAMSCFPQRMNPRAYEVALTGKDGKRLPMAYALEGKTGLVETRDYRGKDVIAAYGPTGALGLGMVVKMDAAELLAPVHKQLLTVLAVCALLVAGGAVLLRRLLRPIALHLVESEEGARAARNWLQFIADNMPAVVAYVDSGERYRFANHTYEEWFGVAPQDMLGRPMRDIMGAERYAAVKPHVERVLRGEKVEFESTVAGPDGEHVRHTFYLPDRGPDRTLRGFFILSNDISRLAEARKALAQIKQRLDFALDASQVAVWETDARTGETVLSEAWAEMLDRPPGETHTTVAELAALVHPTEEAEIRRMQMSAITGASAAYAVEHRVRAAGGHWKWVLSRGRVTERDPATGRALRMMGTNVDITARKMTEQHMEKLASYDTLTGAANRALFSDRVSRAIVRNRRSGGRAALMYLDIDKFKGVNDSLGHAAGDALLKEFAERLHTCVRATDTVGRLGGDEFAVLLEDVTEPGAAVRVADKILAAVRAPMHLEAHTVTVTTSVGIVEFGAEGEEFEALAKRGDAALYAAKAAGRDTYRLAA